MDCRATLDNGLVCGAPTGGSFEACAHCTERIHRQMLRMLHKYGEDHTARTLDVHYQAHHSPARRGLVCPQCFERSWYKTVIRGGLPLTAPGPTFTV